MAKTIKTTVRIPEDLFWTFKEVAAQRRMTERAAFEEALRKWIAGDHGKSQTKNTPTRPQKQP